MPPIISLGRSFVQGEQLTPTKLNELVDTATVSGFALSDFDLGTLNFYTYGPVRPTLARGAVQRGESARRDPELLAARLDDCEHDRSPRKRESVLRLDADR